MREMSPIAGQDGLRSRKARRTRDGIASEALRLFLDRGFEKTTVEAIAEAAQVSRRTFFHYFSSKEAILEAVDDDVHEAFRTSLTNAGRLAPLGAVEAALTELIGRYGSDEAIALDRLMHSTEALRARKHANYGRQEKALLEALVEIWPDPARRSALRMVAMASIGALRVATERWRDDPAAHSLTALLKQAFADLRNEAAI